MYHIIINPASRSGKGMKIWNLVEAELKKREIEYQAFLSKKAGELISLAQKISSQASAANPISLIILGGDGTVNEVLCGLENLAHITIGYIPTGSSNDLARDLGISSKPLQALECILSCKNITKMDMGTLTYNDNSSTRNFSVSSGIGFDAAVCYYVNHSVAKKKFNRIGLGKLVYLWIALREIFGAPRVSCDMYLDDNPTPVHLPNFLTIVSMIHKYEGGGFKFCPDADYADGIFSICTVGNLPKWKILFCLPTVFWGGHYSFKEIQAHSANTIRIETSAPLFVHTDGEVIRESSSITLSCRKQILNFINN